MNPTHVAHPVLGISELLHLVLDELYRANQRRSLVSVALTCQEFLEPALSAVWRSLSGILHLLSILPLVKRGQYILLAHDIPDHAWARFDTYARRVREYTESISMEYNGLDIHPSVVSQLQLRRPLLLPRLQVIYYHSQDLVSFLPLMASKSLRLLKYNPSAPWNCGRDRAKTLWKFLNNFSVNASSLQHLDVRVSTGDAYLAPIFSFSGLRILWINGLSWSPSGCLEFLAKASALPSLEDLSFSMRGYDNFTLSPLPFPNLHKLWISCATHNIVTILGAFSVPQLIQLEVRCVPRSPKKACHPPWRSCFELIAHYKTLQHLFFNYHGPSRRFPQEGLDTVHGIADIKPALALSGLQTFVIEPFTDLDEDAYSWKFFDDDIHSLATSWPSMSCLVLPSNPRTSTLSIHALRHLAELCPNLESLAIAVDFSKGKDAHILFASSNVTLCDLDLQYSALSDVDLIFRQLKSLFPRLGMVFSSLEEQKYALAINQRLQKTD